MFRNGGAVLTFAYYLEQLKNKRVCVIGAGISNTPLIEALINAGITTVICDRRRREEFSQAERYESMGAELALGEDYLASIDADVIFRTPGLMPDSPALKEAVLRGAVLTSEMEVFFEVCPCKIVAVTGSDGKTTTTSLIAKLLKNEGSANVHIGGNIGRPLLCDADKMKPEDIAVLELSSFQLITMKGKGPDIAVVTNVAPNHLDTHRDMDEYVGAKRNIYVNQPESGVAVFNCDNDITRDFSRFARGETLFFSRREKVLNGFYLDGDTVCEAAAGKSEKIMPVSDILLPGVHNIENVMAAFCAVRGFVSRETMIETAKTFAGVAHRIELIRELRGVRYYNDSIASSPTRTIAGLHSFAKKVILIAGGKDKGVPFDELGPEIIAHVKTLVLTGLTAQKLCETVVNSPGYEGSPEIIMKPDFYDAVLAASGAAEPGDVVLLSPACTSFDRFKNFEERGDTFREIVKGIV